MFVGSGLQARDILTLWSHPDKGQILVLSYNLGSCGASVMKALESGRREEAGRLIRNRAFWLC